MRNSRTKLLCVLFVLIFYSCKKYREYHCVTKIQGKVLEYGTLNPITNAKVDLVIYSGDLISNPGAFDFKEMATTDADGNYSFEFKAERGKSYYLRSHANEYLTTASEDEFYLQAEQYLGKKKNKIDLTLDPIGYVQFHVKNVNGTCLEFYLGNNYFTTDPFTYRQPRFYGTNLDTIIVSGIRGNHENDNGWGCFTDGTFNPFTKYYPGHDTTEILIEY